MAAPARGLLASTVVDAAGNSRQGRSDFDLVSGRPHRQEVTGSNASEDGEESPPPNDFHIRNESDRLRTPTVDPDAEVAWLPNPGDPERLEVVAYVAWLAEQPGRAVAPGVWLNVEDGRVVSIEEQYVP